MGNEDTNSRIRNGKGVGRQHRNVGKAKGLIKKELVVPSTGIMLYHQDKDPFLLWISLFTGRKNSTLRGCFGFGPISISSNIIVCLTLIVFTCVLLTLNSVWWLSFVLPNVPLCPAFIIFLACFVGQLGFACLSWLNTNFNKYIWTRHSLPVVSEVRSKTHAHDSIKSHQ